MTARHHRTEDEQELKIKLSETDLEKVFNSLVRKYAPSDIEHKYMPRAYYDTGSMELYKSNISLRMQYKAGKDKAVGGYEQTVKFDLPPGNAMAEDAVFRREVKDFTPDHKPDLSAVTDAKTKPLLKPFLKKRLKHVFTVAIERRYFELEVGKGKNKGTVEVAFDIGEIILPHNGRHYPIYEIEVEKKSGSAKAIDLMREEILEKAESAEIQPLSKAQQGSRKYLNSIGRMKKPGKP